MNSTACSQCGEKILPYWTLCPVCATPFADAVTIDPKSKLSLEEVGQQEISCVQCKGILSPEAQICSHCHVLIVRRYCSGCSRLIPDQAGWCPYCGTSALAKRSRLKLYLQSAAILLVAGSIFAGIFFMIQKEPAKDSTQPVSVVQKKALPEPSPQVDVKKETKPEKSKIEEVKPPIPVPEEIVEPEWEPEPTEPLEEAIQHKPAVVKPVMLASSNEVADENWQERGARLLQGRKLTQNASKLMQKGKYTDASIVLMEALRVFPEKTGDLSYGEALYKLGVCLRKKGQPEQAIPVFREALRFAYYRSKVLREVEAATSELNRARLTSSTKSKTRK